MRIISCPHFTVQVIYVYFNLKAVTPSSDFSLSHSQAKFPYNLKIIIQMV